MDSDDDMPPVLVETAVKENDNEAEDEVENGPKVPLTIVTGEWYWSGSYQIRFCSIK